LAGKGLGEEGISGNKGIGIDLDGIEGFVENK
jgi:hypothetical protein